MKLVLDTNVLVSGLLFGGVPGRILAAWSTGAFSLVISPPIAEGVSEDPDADMFLAAAVAGHAKLIVSGDKHLLPVSGWEGIAVLRPREFSDRYLELSGL